MNLQIKKNISGYNNEILISKKSFKPGINHVNETLHKASIPRHKVIPSPNKKLVPHHKKIIKSEDVGRPTIIGNTVTHEEEKVALVLLITTGFSIRYMF